MKKIRKNLLRRINVNIKRVAFEGIGLTLFLMFALVGLISNTIRVIQNGQNNLSIYSEEANSLINLKDQNEELKRELEIVSLEEYQILMAREILGLAMPNEQLMRIDKDDDFYVLQPEYIDVYEKGDYTDWWFSLVR